MSDESATGAPDARQLVETMQQSMDSMVTAVRLFTEQFTRAMREFWNSPNGQYLIRVAECYRDHPDELDAMIRARELEAATPCSRFCGRCDRQARETLAQLPPQDR